MAGYSAHTDQELLLLLKEGDHAAFGEIHKRYYPVLYSHAFKRLPYREEVKDILQELFAYVWNNRENLNFTSGLAAYLYTSVRNRVINVFTKDKTRQEYAVSFAKYAEEGENQTDELLREKELAALIEKEIAALPEKMRQVFEMSRFQHLSHNEIAEITNTSPLTVRKQIQNTLKILRTKLSSAIFVTLV
jgi:RNA polymerase sigma-70 factor (family 1)